MDKIRIRKLKLKIISLILIWGLLWGAFIGLMVFDGIRDEPNVEAMTLIVDINGGGNYTSIQNAVDNATAGDTIRVYAGTYYEDVLLNKTITLIGNGSANTIISRSSSTCPPAILIAIGTPSVISLSCATLFFRSSGS